MSTVPNFSVENDRESLNNVNCESLQVSGDLTVGSDLTVGGTINPAFSPNGVSTAIPVAVGNTDISVVQPPNSVLTSITVVNTPPRYPSHVFFGLSLIKGVCPRKNPNGTLKIADFVDLFGVCGPSKKPPNYLQLSLQG